MIHESNDNERRKKLRWKMLPKKPTEMVDLRVLGGIDQLPESRS